MPPLAKPAVARTIVAAALLLGVVADVLAADGAALVDPRRALQAACYPAAGLVAQPDERSPRRISRSQGFKLPITPTLNTAPVPQALRGAIRRVELPPGRKLIALTLDFCETAGEISGYDGAILDYLRATGTKATLFMGGKWMLSHPGRTGQMMVDPLFEMGTHGYAHINTRLVSGAALMSEIASPNDAYRLVRQSLAANQCAVAHRPAMAAVPETPRLFRFPFGACNRDGLAATTEAGLLAIQWDVSTGDPWSGQSARAIADVMIRQTKPGSIILAHANGRGFNTAEALPLAIPKLKALGFEFVTVSELLAAGKPVVSDTCYDAKPGDTDKYDRLFPVGGNR